MSRVLYNETLTANTVQADEVLAIQWGLRFLLYESGQIANALKCIPDACAVATCDVPCYRLLSMISEVGGSHVQSPSPVFNSCSMSSIPEYFPLSTSTPASRPAQSLSKAEDVGALLGVAEHGPKYTQRRQKIGPRVYIACLTIAILYLLVRTCRGYFAVRQLATFDSLASSQESDIPSQVIKVTVAESTTKEPGRKPKKHKPEPNCRRQYWSRLGNGRWIAGQKESWIAEPGTACSEDDDPVSAPPKKPQCPDTSSILLVLLTPSAGASPQISTYLSHVPCVSPTTSLALYSFAPGEVLLPYPHTDCLSCNARVSVRVHDSLALAEANFTLPGTVARLHETVLQQQTHRIAAFPFEEHKAFAELQKFRLLPALIHAYNTHSTQQWFVVATTEVHVSLRNIAAWTRSLKRRGPIYAGAEMVFEGQEFAPLDAGIILNREAVGRLVKYGAWEVLPVSDPELVEQIRKDRASPKRPVHDTRVNRSPEGTEGRELPEPWRPKESYLMKWYNDLATSSHADVALASALRDIGVNLTRNHPLMRANSILDIDWARDSWCKTALTWGKTDDAQHEILAKAERQIAKDARKRRKPQPPRGPGQMHHRNASTHHPHTPRELGTFGSLFRHALLPKLVRSPELLSWDNEAADVEYYEGKGDYHHAAKSFMSSRACMGACALAMDCLQWRWEPGRCRLGTRPTTDACIQFDRS